MIYTTDIWIISYILFSYLFLFFKLKFYTAVTYDYYAVNILMNPHHGEEWWEILPINYYSILFTHLFKLSSDAQKIVDDFKVKYLR